MRFKSVPPDNLMLRSTERRIVVRETSGFSKFLEAIYGDSEGYIALVTLDDDTHELSSQRWFHWPSEASMAAKYAALRDDEDLYCTVGLYSDKERTRDDLQAVSRVVYADLDTCHPDNLRVPPTISVQTSEDRWHGWWVLDEEVLLKDAAEASRRIYEAHKDQGVDRGWHVTKLLRVPGTTNRKYDEPHPVIATYSDQVYTLDTINDVYGDVTFDEAATLVSNKMPKPVTPGSKAFVALEQRLDSAGLTSLYLNPPAEGQSWSEMAYRLELDLFRKCDMTPQEVFSVMLEAACNKYNPENIADGAVTQTGVPIPKRRNHQEVLWREVLKAYAEHQATANIIVESSPGVRRPEKAQFLSVEERRFCAERPTFIDRYVEWVATRTDAAQTYSRTLGWILLSSVFAGRGYLPLKYNPRTELNLWALILGDTTRTRKTTAVNLMMYVLHRYEALSQMVIDIGSDATTEALTRVLADRDGQVSLMYNDEFNGYLAETMGKNYRAGTLEVMTKLYDGKVPQVLRNSKDAGNRKRARTVFNFVGVGIRAQTAEILTKRNFQSGFLARMLWSVADPPPRRKGSEDVAFADEDEVSRKYDTVMEDMVADLIRRVRKWPEDTPQAIRMDQAAINRYNKWAEEGMTLVENYHDSDILMPSFTRLGDSVLKAAALLAMYDQSDTITLAHLLPTLLQAESWFNDMVRMASEVSSSDFERRLNEVEAFIMSGENQTRLESSIRKKFSRFRPRDIEEIFLALVQSGRIKRLTGQKFQAMSV